MRLSSSKAAADEIYSFDASIKTTVTILLKNKTFTRACKLNSVGVNFFQWIDDIRAPVYTRAIIGDCQCSTIYTIVTRRTLKITTARNTLSSVRGWELRKNLTGWCIVQCKHGKGIHWESKGEIGQPRSIYQRRPSSRRLYNIYHRGLMRARYKDAAVFMGFFQGEGTVN